VNGKEIVAGLPRRTRHPGQPPTIRDKIHPFASPTATPNGRFLVLLKVNCAGGRMATEDSLPFRTPYPHWQNEYAAALVEVDRKRLPKRVAPAIFNRLQVISQGSDHQAERLAIEDALAALRVLKRDEIA